MVANYRQRSVARLLSRILAKKKHLTRTRQLPEEPVIALNPFNFEEVKLILCLEQGVPAEKVNTISYVGYKGMQFVSVFGITNHDFQLISKQGFIDRTAKMMERVEEVKIISAERNQKSERLPSIIERSFWEYDPTRPKIFT